MSSKELVPLSYGRNVWNKIHQSDLPNYQGVVPPEYLEEINEVYDTRLYLGTHGSSRKTGNAGIDAAIRPTQREYTAARRTVDALLSSDVLFLENYGYTDQPASPLSSASIYMVQLAVLGGSIPKRRVLQGIKTEQKETLEDIEAQRDGYLISAWDYAYRLARHRGIKTVFADVDAYQELLFKEQHRGLPLSELYLAGDESVVNRIHRIREQRVAKTVVHCALAGLSSARVASQKPVLAVMFGGGHRETLPEAFDNEGLAYSVHDMDATESLYDRLIEQSNFVTQQVKPLLMEL